MVDSIFRRRILLILISATLVVAGSCRAGQGPIRRRIAQGRQQRSSEPVTLSPRGAASCDSALNVGFRIHRFPNGLKAAVWYPTTAAESQYQYPNQFSTSLAVDGPVADCGRFPLVVYSHGLGGCGTVSVFFTEELARHGYIAIAPDHKDSQCKSDEPRSGRYRITRAEERLGKPETWSDETYLNRRVDVETCVDGLLRHPEFGPHIDSGRIGGAGHSLGGYTMMGIAGGWASWRDRRFRAMLLMSPYVDPYVAKGTIGIVNVPLMYQGGTRDIGITPRIRRSGGAYDQSNPPKYFVDFSGVGHMMWSNAVCRGDKTVQQCLSNETAQLINRYGIAFLDEYVKGERRPILTERLPELADFRYQVR